MLHFKSKDLEKFFFSGKSKTFPQDLQKRLLRKLKVLENTVDVEDLRVPPSNHLEKLLGDLDGFYSIRVNDQWRLIFKFKDSNAYEVYLDDYH